ncbi:Tn3 family transposase post-transcriptional regulator TnpC [Cupriavidus metallidurans]|jgi:hypothetical protein|uniref:Tn3 family transposase post-transcriptional regulator TnpC n=1 Tax=Cupriavidus metallidurans TaxID=119219 RepID=UPI001F3D65B1|nr:Tn3 family transposase post-transcriptional regulator TnpC [Cupriavidus metallidurans]
MSDSDDTVETAYGRLDRAALLQAQHTYDTTILLCMVDDLDAMLAEARAEDGLRDMLLRLHGMAHTVINGAGMTVATGEQRLPELAFDTLAEVLKIVTMLHYFRLMCHFRLYPGITPAGRSGVPALPEPSFLCVYVPSMRTRSSLTELTNTNTSGPRCRIAA